MAFVSIGFLPAPLETPRLVLQPVRDPEQAAAARRVALTPDIRSALDLPRDFSAAELRRRLHAPPLRHLYLLQRNGADCPRGVLALWRPPDGSGWWRICCGILPPHRGQGLAGEAAAAVMRRLFQEPLAAGVLVRMPAGNLAGAAAPGRLVPEAGVDTLEYRLGREAYLEAHPLQWNRPPG
jgi:hypothetical protein